ncbi:MAG: type II toxin-antitoxin system HipA family toxin [Bdellovibrionota bacterium]
MQQLWVVYQGKKVGTVHKDVEETLSFQYASSWLQDPQAFPISFSLPLQDQPFGNKSTLAFFENLLPEGEVLHDLSKSKGISDTFELIKHFGKDCAGALSIYPEDFDQLGFTGEVKKIDLEKIYAALEEKISIAQMVADESPGYLSIAGAQDKFPCIYRDGNIYLPEDGSPTTHIVKAPIWRHGVKESVLNEYFCMTLADKVGLKTSPCFVVDGLYPLFMIERYDRQHIEKNVYIRLHQEDLCQAQGMLAKYKYEMSGGPSIQDNFHFIQKHIHVQHRYQALEDFQSWIAFNLIIGNNDSHSKNISILRNEKSQYVLAPFYDLLSTSIYPKLERNFSFMIGGRNEFSKIGKNQINLLEDQCELKRGAFQEQLQNMAQKIENKISSHRIEIERMWPGTKIAKKIQQEVAQRLKSLRIQKAID